MHVDCPRHSQFSTLDMCSNMEDVISARLSDYEADLVKFPMRLGTSKSRKSVVGFSARRIYYNRLCKLCSNIDLEINYFTDDPINEFYELLFFNTLN